MAWSRVRATDSTLAYSSGIIAPRASRRSRFRASIRGPQDMRPGQASPDGSRPPAPQRRKQWRLHAASRPRSGRRRTRGWSSGSGPETPLFTTSLKRAASRSGSSIGGHVALSSGPRPLRPAGSSARPKPSPRGSKHRAFKTACRSGGGHEQASMDGMDPRGWKGSVGPRLGCGGAFNSPHHPGQSERLRRFLSLELPVLLLDVDRRCSATAR